MKTVKNILIILVIAAIGASIWYTKGRSTKSGDPDVPLFTVEKGPLTISVLEAGTIKAREVEIITCQVEGMSTILWLIDEATRVKKGDKLIELDSSKFIDNKVDQEIIVKNANAAVIIATENLAVIKNKATSDIEQATLDLKFAKMDLKKYIEGEYPNQLEVNQTNILLAKAELGRAAEKLTHSEKLAKEKYISSTELKTDTLTFNRAELELKLAENNLSLLEDYSHKRDLEALQSNVKQTEMALERTNRSAGASVVGGEIDLQTKQAQADKEKKLLEKIADQISKTVIYAPRDGMVIYATSTKASWRGNDEPLEEGQQVRERLELFHLPTADLVKVVARIHEANLDKVKEGYPVTIKVDAVPGEVFTGTVTKIAILPDQQSIWMNPNLKVYNTEINLNDEGPGSASRRLRTGMGCQIEVLTAEFDDVVYVPVQSVITVGDQPTVYVYKNGKSKSRKVEIGQDNNRMVHIKSGLQKGEKVLLAPPLAEAEVKNNGKKKKSKGNRKPRPRDGKGMGKTRPEKK